MPMSTHPHPPVPTAMWLLDPVNVDIDPALASNIVGNLASTNVTISASNDINVNAPVVYTSANIR